MEEEIDSDVFPVSGSSYRSYPAMKPFINSEWIRQSQSFSKGFPESNRDCKIF